MEHHAGEDHDHNQGGDHHSDPQGDPHGHRWVGSEMKKGSPSQILVAMLNGNYDGFGNNPRIV